MEETNKATFERHPAKNRRGKIIEGIWFRWGKHRGDKKPERIFYAVFTRNGKKIETMVGRERQDGVTASQANQERTNLINGKKTRKEERAAAAAAAANRLDFDGLWKSYQEWRTSAAIVGEKGPWTRQESDRSNYKNFLQGIVGSKTPAEVSDDDIERIHGKMAQTKGLKGNKTLAPASRRMILALLVRVATFGTEKKKCPGLIVPVVLPTVDNEVTEVLTKEEMARLLKVLQAGTYTDKKGVTHAISRDAVDLVFVAITTGMRRGEILGIEWKNVDYQAETILVPHPKERRRKHVHINRIVLDVLKSREGNGSRFVFPARDWKEKDGHITDPKRSLHVIKRAAGLPGDFRPCHSYRHVWATTALTPVEDGGAGIDIYTVSKSLGHRSIETTERYLTLIDKSKKSASDRVAAIFAPKELLPANVVPITKVSS